MSDLYIPENSSSLLQLQLPFHHPEVVSSWELLHIYEKKKKIHTFCPPFPSSIKRKWFIPISNILSLLFRKRFQNYPSLFLPLPGPLFCFPSSKPRESMVPWLLSFMHFHNTLGIMQWSVKLMRWYLTDFISHSLNIMVFKLTHFKIPSLFDRRNVTAIFRKFFLALLG